MDLHAQTKRCGINTLAGSNQEASCHASVKDLLTSCTSRGWIQRQSSRGEASRADMLHLLAPLGRLALHSLKHEAAVGQPHHSGAAVAVAAALVVRPAAVAATCAAAAAAATGPSCVVVAGGGDKAAARNDDMQRAQNVCCMRPAKETHAVGCSKIRERGTTGIHQEALDTNIITAAPARSEISWNAIGWVRTQPPILYSP